MGRRALKSLHASALLLAMIGVMVVLAGPSRATEAAGEAKQVVHDLAADIWLSRGAPDKAGRQKLLAEVIEGSTSVDLLSRLALGRHWRTLDAMERQEYQDLFSQVVIGGLAGRLDGLIGELDGPLEQHFAITNSTTTGKRDVLVRSKVMPLDGQPVSVDWRLRSLENGPVIIDLVIEGISLLVSQRAEFAAVIEKNRVEGLISALRRRADNVGF